MPGSFGWTQGEPPLYNFAVGLDTLNEILTFDFRLLTCLNHAALEGTGSDILYSVVSQLVCRAASRHGGTARPGQAPALRRILGHYP